MADGSASTAAPVITAPAAMNLAASRLRQRLAHVGTCQVEPHWAHVIVETRSCHGNRMPRSWPPGGIRVKAVTAGLPVGSRPWLIW